MGCGRSSKLRIIQVKIGEETIVPISSDSVLIMQSLIQELITYNEVTLHCPTPIRNLIKAYLETLNLKHLPINVSKYVLRFAEIYHLQALFNLALEVNFNNIDQVPIKISKKPIIDRETSTSCRAIYDPNLINKTLGNIYNIISSPKVSPDPKASSKSRDVNNSSLMGGMGATLETIIPNPIADNCILEHGNQLVILKCKMCRALVCMECHLYLHPAHIKSMDIQEVELNSNEEQPIIGKGRGHRPYSPCILHFGHVVISKDLLLLKQHPNYLLKIMRARVVEGNNQGVLILSVITRIGSDTDSVLRSINQEMEFLRRLGEFGVWVGRRGYNKGETIIEYILEDFGSTLDTVVRNGELKSEEDIINIYIQLVRGIRHSHTVCNIYLGGAELGDILYNSTTKSIKWITCSRCIYFQGTDKTPPTLDTYPVLENLRGISTVLLPPEISNSFASSTSDPLLNTVNFKSIEPTNQSKQSDPPATPPTPLYTSQMETIPYDFCPILTEMFSLGMCMYQIVTRCDTAHLRLLAGRRRVAGDSEDEQATYMQFVTRNILRSKENGDWGKGVNLIISNVLNALAFDPIDRMEITFHYIFTQIYDKYTFHRVIDFPFTITQDNLSEYLDGNLEVENFTKTETNEMLRDMFSDLSDLYSIVTETSYNAIQLGLFNVENAISFLTAAIERSHAIFGGVNNEIILDIYRLKADYLLKKNNYREAIKIYQICAKIVPVVYGNISLKCVEINNCIGGCYQGNADYKLANKYYKDSLKMHLDICKGILNIEFSRSLNHLANLKWLRGANKESAYQDMKKSLGINILLTTGLENVHAWMSILNLGIAASEINKVNEAANKFELCLQLAKKQNYDNVFLRRVLHHLIDISKKQVKPEDTKKYKREYKEVEPQWRIQKEKVEKPRLDMRELFEMVVKRTSPKKKNKSTKEEEKQHIDIDKLVFDHLITDIPLLHNIKVKKSLRKAGAWDYWIESKKKRMDLGILELREGRYLPTGEIYIGYWNKKEGKREGKGMCLNTRTGTIYEGFWEKDRHSGRGREISSSGDIYTGEFNDNQKHGAGYLKERDGSTHEGDFLRGLQHGYYKQTWEDGHIYEGYYEGGKKHGKGTEKEVDGSEYVGMFSKGLRNGKGFFKLGGTLHTYEGDWKDGDLDGKGVFVWTDGRIYKGEYIKGKQHGYGIMEWTDSSIYKGLWKDNLQDGKGTFINSEGERQIAIWSKGEVKKLIC